MATTTEAPNTIESLEKQRIEIGKTLTDLQNKLTAEDKTLSATQAQYDESCRLAASGQDSDPEQYAVSIARIQHRMKGLKSLIADSNDQEQKLNAALRPLVDAKIRQEEDQQESEFIAAHENSKRARGIAEQALTEAKNAEFRAFQALDQHRRKVTHQRDLRAQSAQLFAVATA